MDYNDLLLILERGEDSYYQFKAKVESIDNLAVEIGAFANSDGGYLIIGVGNTGEIVGLSKEEVDSINQWISNATSQKIEPPLADEMETEAMIEDFDAGYFKHYYDEIKKGYEKELDKLGIPLETLLENIKLLRNNRLTLAGLLLFGKNPENIKPQFGIKGTFYDGISISVNRYKDSIRTSAKLIDQFTETLHFIRRNLRMIQSGTDFNSPPVLEIPEAAFAETVANAIAHRDYFINSQIFVSLFDDRLEIVSPGILPNTLTEENIKYGVQVFYRPVL